MIDWMYCGLVSLVLMYIVRKIKEGKGPIWTYKNHGLLAMWRGVVLCLILGPLAMFLFLYLQWIEFKKRK